MRHSRYGYRRREIGVVKVYDMIPFIDEHHIRCSHGVGQDQVIGVGVGESIP